MPTIRQMILPTALILLAVGKLGYAQTSTYRSSHQNIFAATTHGYHRDVIYHLENGARVDARDNQGFTPLHYAAAFNTCPFVANVLVSSGADVNARAKDGSTPLDIARSKGNVAVVAYLTNPQYRTLVSTMHQAHEQQLKEALQKDFAPKFTSSEGTPTRSNSAYNQTVSTAQNRTNQVGAYQYFPPAVSPPAQGVLINGQYIVPRAPTGNQNQYQVTTNQIVATPPRGWNASSQTQYVESVRPQTNSRTYQSSYGSLYPTAGYSASDELRLNMEISQINKESTVSRR